MQGQPACGAGQAARDGDELAADRAGTLTGGRHATATTGTIRAPARARPSSDRFLGPTARPAPADRLALADRLDRTVHPRLRTTRGQHDLTPATRPYPEKENPDEQVGYSTASRTDDPRLTPNDLSSTRSSVDRG